MLRQRRRSQMSARQKVPPATSFTVPKVMATLQLPISKGTLYNYLW